MSLYSLGLTPFRRECLCLWVLVVRILSSQYWAKCNKLFFIFILRYVIIIFLVNYFIFMNIANIIFNKNDDKWNCIDGKQRLTSIIKFKNNEISIKLDDDTEIYYKHCPVGEARIMTKQERSIFENTSINFWSLFTNWSNLLKIWV